MSDETIKLIAGFLFSFLGGGIVVAIFDWIRINKAEKLQRRLEILNNQIRNLYGPLYFFTSQNEKCFALNDSILKAYDKEYVEQQWSQDDITSANLKKNTTLTLDVANAYVHLATANNDRIFEILSEHYSLIDPDDQDVFQQFVMDYNRLKTERDDTGTIKMPFEIYKHLGSISFMRPTFIERVKTKFNAKKQQIEEINR